MASVITAEEFVKSGGAALKFTPKYKNKQGKAEIRPFTGKLKEKKRVFLQFGTMEDPLATRGVLRWDNNTKKFYEIDSPNPTWAVVDRSGFNNLMTKKVYSEVKLYNYDKSGSSAYYAYEAIRLYVAKVVDAAVNGIADEDGKITKVFEDGDVTEDLVRRFLTLPYQEPRPNDKEEGKMWAPVLKPKVRVSVVDEFGKTAKAKEDYTAEQVKTFTLAIEPKIYDGSPEAKEPTKPVKNTFDHFKKGAVGSWICELVPIVFKSKSEINITVELKKARVTQRKDVADELDFVDEPIFGGFGSGANDEEGGEANDNDNGDEPSAKRQKIKTEEPLFIA